MNLPKGSDTFAENVLGPRDTMYKWAKSVFSVRRGGRVDPDRLRVQAVGGGRGPSGRGTRRGWRRAVPGLRDEVRLEQFTQSKLVISNSDTAIAISADYVVME